MPPASHLHTDRGEERILQLTTIFKDGSKNAPTAFYSPVGYSHNSWQKKNSKDQRLNSFGCFLYTTIFRQMMRKNDKKCKITNEILLNYM